MSKISSIKNEQVGQLEVELGCSIAATLTRSPRVLQAAAMFGLGIQQREPVTVLSPLRLRLGRGHIVFVTGPSGSGKSTLLRLITRALSDQRDQPNTPNNPDVSALARRLDNILPPVPVLDFADLHLASDSPLVDSLGERPLNDIMKYLSLAGLNDAFVMLRRPTELSDGQRYRWRLARVMAQVDQLPPLDTPLPRAVVLADEFGATLDRHTAKVVARNVRKWVSRSDVCFIAATTHDDLLEPFAPDVLVEKGFTQHIAVVYRDEISRG